MTLSTLTLIEGSVNANVLLTKVTKAQKDALPNLEIGETVYQTDNNIGMQIYNGTSWDSFKGSLTPNVQTTLYTPNVSDNGKIIIMSGDAITIPAGIFNTGDHIQIVSNTQYNVSILCSNVTAYIAGSNTIKTTVTLATRGRCEILFYEPNKVVISGNVN
jgi:hypothetical protein